MTTDNGVDSKDITYDLILDDTDAGAGGGDRSPPPEDRGDHPVVTILDMAVSQSGVYLKKQGLEPPNSAVYESFSRPFLNTAAWHYLPDGSIPDDPRIALVLGVAGLGLAFAPTLIAVYQKRDAEEKRKAEEKKRKAEEKTQDAEDRGDTVPGPVGPVSGPDEVPGWMRRLEGGSISGL